MRTRPSIVTLVLCLRLTEVSSNDGRKPPIGSAPLQACADPKRFPVNDLCRPVIRNQSYLITTNFTTLDDVVGKTFRSLIYVQSEDCRKAIVNFACGIWYPICEIQQSMRKVSCPCPSEQTRLQQNCKRDNYGHYLATYATGLLPNLTSHPACGNLSQAATDQAYLSCHRPYGATGGIACPPEMVHPDVPGSSAVDIDVNEGPDWPVASWKGGTVEVCQTPCYPSLFSQGEMHTSVKLVTTLAWISTLSSFLLFFLFHLWKDLRAWPERMQVYVTICVFFLSLSLTFGSMLGYSDSMWCEYQTLCTVQALMLEFFGLALAMWWLLICFNLFLSIVVYRKDGSSNQDIMAATEWWEKFYHGVGWGVPIFLTLILAYNYQLGSPAYGNPSYCWIKDENTSVWEFSCFFIEILGIVLVGMLFFCASMIKLRKLTSKELSIWQLMWKLGAVLTFILAFAFTFTFMGIYQIYLSRQEGQDRQAYNEYIQCVIKRWWKSAFPGESPPVCELKSHPDLVFMDVQSACFASLGFVTFVVFGWPHCGTVIRKVDEMKQLWQGRQDLRSTCQSTVKETTESEEQLLHEASMAPTQAHQVGQEESRSSVTV